MKKTMQMVTTLVLVLIMAMTPLTAYARTANNDVPVRHVRTGENATVSPAAAEDLIASGNWIRVIPTIPFGRMTVANFFRDFATSYEVSTVTLSAALPYANILANGPTRPGYGATNIEAARFTRANRDTTELVNSQGGVIITGNTISIFHFNEDARPISVAIPRGITFAVLESWDLGGANGAMAAALEAAYLLSKENGFLTSVHIRVYGNGELLFLANAVAPGTDQVAVPELPEQEVQEVPPAGGRPPAEDVAPPSRFPKPENNQGWHEFMALYGGRITVQTVSGNLRYQNHLNANHFNGNQTLVHSDVVWVRSNGTAVNIPQYNVLVSTNGMLRLNHFGEGQQVTVTVPAGQYFAVIPSNDMSGANGAMASIVEAIWVLGNRVNGLPWIDGSIYGNGEVVGRIWANPNPPR